MYSPLFSEKGDRIGKNEKNWYSFITQGLDAIGGWILTCCKLQKTIPKE